MLKLGAQNVKGLHLNGQEVKRAYLGSELVFDTGGLPSGYTALEYIQSSGTQYIETGFNPTSQTSISARLKIPEYAKRVCLFGARDGTSDASKNQLLVFYTGTNYLRYDYFDGQKVTISSNLSGEVNLLIDKNIVTIGESSVSAKQPAEQSEVSYGLILFAMNNSGSLGYKSTFTLYSFQISNNGTLVRDFAPCKNPSGAVGLYDMVGRTFYGNAGTGTFTAGSTV